jgi:hypothetical protein
MKTAFNVKWTAASALGLGVAFVAYLQIPMLVRFGLDFERHWQWQEQAVEANFLFYAESLVELLVAGAIFGASQALALRSDGLRVVPWIFATAVGFVLLVAVFWPLAAAGVLGIIPGPVEPILFTVVGGSLAGVCQYQALRRQGIAASRWLVRWIVGVVGGLALNAAFFMSVEGAGIDVGWLLEIFFSGIWVAGVAAFVSGRTLFSALSSGRPQPAVSRAPAAEGTR